MGRDNGLLLAHRIGGALMFKASNGALLYDITDIPDTDHIYTIDTAAYLSLYQSCHYTASQDFSSAQFDYWWAHRNELRDALDAANRPQFNVAPLTEQSRYYRFANICDNDINISPGDSRRNEVEYTSICIAFSTSDLPDFSTISHVELDISCGRNFYGAESDDFDDSFYADGVFTATPNLTSVDDILSSPHFRVNIGDCQRWTASHSSQGYCYMTQSGYLSTNEYTPVQTVRIDDAIPHLKQLGGNPRTLYLYMAIEGPTHIPMINGQTPRRTGVIACPYSINIIGHSAPSVNPQPAAASLPSPELDWHIHYDGVESTEELKGSGPYRLRARGDAYSTVATPTKRDPDKRTLMLSPNLRHHYPVLGGTRPRTLNRGAKPLPERAWWLYSSSEVPKLELDEDGWVCYVFRNRPAVATVSYNPKNYTASTVPMPTETLEEKMMRGGGLSPVNIMRERAY